MWILNIWVLASASEIGALILYFTKLILRIQKKLENIVNISVFFIKISCESKASFPCLDKTLCKGGGGSNYAHIKMKQPARIDRRTVVYSILRKEVIIVPCSLL